MIALLRYIDFGIVRSTYIFCVQHNHVLRYDLKKSTLSYIYGEQSILMLQDLSLQSEKYVVYLW